MQQEIKKILQPQVIERDIYVAPQGLEPSIEGQPVLDIMDIPGDAHTILKTLAEMV